MTLDAADDPGKSHVAQGSARDLFVLRWRSHDRSLRGLVRVEVSAARRASRFVATIRGPGRRPVVVLEDDLPLPAPTFEFRSSGIWTDLVCETPLEHWTVGLEAFGLAVEPGEAVTASTFGDRVPVGLDLDVESVGPVRARDRNFAVEVAVHGEVLVGSEAFDLDGLGVRGRRWDR